MTRLIRVAALAFVLVAAFGGWRWWNGPERQIRRLLSEIESELSPDGGQRGLQDMAAAASLGRRLAAGVTIEPGEPFAPIAGRDAAVAAAAALRAAAPGMRVAFSDVRIGLAPDGRSATVDATATATFPDPPRAPQREAREALLTVVLEDGHWVVSRASAVAVIERID